MTLNPKHLNTCALGHPFSRAPAQAGLMASKVVDGALLDQLALADVKAVHVRINT